jgi:hypothetical protein
LNLVFPQSQAEGERSLHWESFMDDTPSSEEQELFIIYVPEILSSPWLKSKIIIENLINFFKQSDSPFLMYMHGYWDPIGGIIAINDVTYLRERVSWVVEGGGGSQICDVIYEFSQTRVFEPVSRNFLLLLRHQKKFL